MERNPWFAPICCANRTPVLEGLQGGYRRVAANSQKNSPERDSGPSIQTALRE